MGGWVAYPEDGHGVVWHYYAAEADQTSADNHRVHDCGEVFIWCVGCDGLAD